MTTHAPLEQVLTGHEVGRRVQSGIGPGFEVVAVFSFKEDAAEAVKRWNAYTHERSPMKPKMITESPPCQHFARRPPPTLFATPFAVGCGVLCILLISGACFHLMHGRPGTGAFLAVMGVVFGVLFRVIAEENRDTIRRGP